MASLTESPDDKGNHRGVKRIALHLDMTPMVDLAFLLLTFFMLTTTFLDRKILPLEMPEKVTDPAAQPVVQASHVVTLILGKDNRIFWFRGIDNPMVRETMYGETGLRDMLFTQKKVYDRTYFMIKPSKDATYRNVVDVMDEMLITDITRYGIVKITGDDLEYVARAKLSIAP